MKGARWIAVGVVAAMGLAGVSGCSIKLVKRSQSDIEQLDALSQQVDELRELSQAKAEEAERLRQAKALLEERLAKEIGEHQVSVGMDERGLVITFLAEILFDSGKATIRSNAQPILDKVARVLQEELVSQPIGIEGHTDNEPIKYSGWKSNWELSTARATSVLHYLVDERSLAPTRVSAIGYGEYRPVASNDTPDGKQQNRRVEVVVLPQALAKVKPSAKTKKAPAAGAASSEPSFFK